MKKKITGKESFGEILEKYPEIGELLFEKGMHCAGCYMSANESLKDGALAHGINPKELIKEINQKLEN
ncbi:DUF1858 domain-containing protein [Candidatus Pacearchaeota archaeon]|nr:DUF1858 domain-containing protein [Candidatus Pacearchaeota archaeon]